MTTPTSILARDEIARRIWAVCSPLAPAEYAEPWAGIGRDLQARLESALTDSDAFKAASDASRLPFAEFAPAIMRSAPAVYRVAADIRGLAGVASPSEARPGKNSEANSAKAALPGEALVYEELPAY